MVNDGEIKLEVGNIKLRFDGCLVHITVRDGDKEITKMLEYGQADLLGRFLSDPLHYWQAVG